MNVVALRQPDYEFNIDADFEDLLSPLPESSLTGLEQDIIENGCRNPLVVWEEENILLDGHHRYSICSKHKIPYKVDRLNFENKEAAKRWIIEHQATQRRNLAPKELSYLRGQYYESVKGERGGDRKSEKVKKSSGHFDHLISEPKIRDLVAEKFGVGDKTIHRDRELFKAITSISQHLGKEARFTLTSSETKLNRDQIKHLGIIFDTEPTAGEECYQTLIHDPDSQRKASQVLQQYESMANRNLELAQKEEDHLEYDESDDDSSFEVSQKMPSSDEKQEVDSSTERIAQEKASETEDQTDAKPVAEKEPLELVPEPPKEYLEAVATADGRTLYIKHTPQTKATFNMTNESIDWAFWSWNPITGCWHGCNYCYARDIANRFWKDVGFEPTFYPDRLNAPANTKPMPEHKIIKEAEARNLSLDFAKIQARNVFTGSMADIFGKWVPQEWILQIFRVVDRNPQWNFLFLT
jgi:hypothetical protein